MRFNNSIKLFSVVDGKTKFGSISVGFVLLKGMESCYEGGSKQKRHIKSTLNS
jgi:hypothetical protein